MRSLPRQAPDKISLINLERGFCMAKNRIDVEEVDVAAIRCNKILAITADKAAVEKCRRALDEFGALNPPVVGALADGSRIVLSGESEFAAIKESGSQKLMAALVSVPADDAGGAKMSLLLSSLRKGPGALCEGMLLRDALDSGANRAEIGRMLSRSASWLSNRLALAERLDGGVRELLSRGLLDARSAQEIARLPGELQHEFADKVVREGLPKSSIESLVAGYNAEHCPEEVKAQIIGDPGAALARMKDGRRAVENTGHKPERHDVAAPKSIAACLTAAKKPFAWLAGALNSASPADASPYRKALQELESDVLVLLGMIRSLVSPGKINLPGEKESLPYAN